MALLQKERSVRRGSRRVRTHTSERTARERGAEEQHKGLELRLARELCDELCQAQSERVRDL